MEQADRSAKERELAELRVRVRQLENDLATPKTPWRPTGFYTAYHATAGFVLGTFAAATSLLLNIVGAEFVGKHPLELIRVYLTFPLGERALSPEMDSGVTLAVGCCLYLATGMLLGVPFHLILTRLADEQSLAKRLAIGTVLGLIVWIVNYYLILAWLQPLLFGGNWIVRMIPPLVAAATHVVFGWTMALVQPLGHFVPYQLHTEQ